MQVWKIAVIPNAEKPYLKSGYCIAETKEDALAMIGEPNGVVFDTPRGKVWPYGAGDTFYLSK